MNKNKPTISWERCKEIKEKYRAKGERFFETKWGRLILLLAVVGGNILLFSCFGCTYNIYLALFSVFLLFLLWSLFRAIRETITGRVILLVLSAFASIYALDYVVECESCACNDSNSIVCYYNLIASLGTGSILLLSLPTALLLWYFRTYDVKSTYNQNELFDGMSRLVDDNPLQIDLGVQKLILLSEKDPSHNESIRLAFIRRLKYLPKEYKDLLQKLKEIENEVKVLKYKEDKEFKKKVLDAGSKYKLAYAQYILEWLYKNKIKPKNLHNACFDFQEFEEKENPLKHFLKKNYKNLSFRWADISEVDLTEAKLIGADLTGANLFEANLSRANFTGSRMDSDTYILIEQFNQGKPEHEKAIIDPP